MYPWAYTWNPLAGKCPHDCLGCYVGGKIAPWLKRMGNNKYVGEPRLVESEFETKLLIPKGYVVFVESCGDLFAEVIPRKWIVRVLDYIRNFPETTFLLQTKNPSRFSVFYIPENCIIGTTIETNRDYQDTKAPSPRERYNAFHTLSSLIYRKMVSIEPVKDFELHELVRWIRNIKPEFVSVGADTGNNSFKEPSSKKLQQLLFSLSFVTEVRRKKNLKRLLEVNVNE